MNFAANGVALLTMCAVCGASDVAGRKGPLLLTLCSMILDASVGAFAVSVRWLAVGYCAAFALGSPWTLLALSFASVGDVLGDSSPHELALDFAFVESTVFAAAVVGPLACGFGVESLGFAPTFLLSAAFAALAALATALSSETLAKPDEAHAKHEKRWDQLVSQGGPRSHQLRGDSFSLSRSRGGRVSRARLRRLVEKARRRSPVAALAYFSRDRSFARPARRHTTRLSLSRIRKRKRISSLSRNSRVLFSPSSKTESGCRAQLGAARRRVLRALARAAPRATDRGPHSECS